MLQAILFAETAGESAPNPLIPADYDIIWSAVCFFVLLAFFAWKVLPNVNKTLDARADAIQGGIEKAEKAQAEADATKAEYTKLLAEARAEAGRIREQARQDGAAIVAEAKENASGEAARILANAQLQIDAERQSALVELRSEVGTLAIDLASGVIGESLADDKRATSLVDRFLADLDADEKAKAGR